MNDLGLSLPERPAKPRTHGLTMALDKGIPLAELEDTLQLYADFVDYVKLGWGTSVVHPALDDKIEVYRRHGIPICLGGTLFELAVVQDRVDALGDRAEALGIEMLEVSDGTIDMNQRDKLGHIARLATRFRVVSEYGSKDDAFVSAPRLWAEGMQAELEAGAWKVIAEGRESGTAGLYRGSSEIRTGLVDEIALSIDPVHVIWEAPRKEHQAWLVQRFGPNVNVGNIAFHELLGLETLRLGLRSDTLVAIHGDGATTGEQQ